MRRTHRHIGLYLLLLLALLAFGQEPARAADDYDAVERALGLLESGETDAARMILSGVPEGSLPALLPVAQATVHLAAGNAAAAETACRAILDKYPQDVAALWNLSLCLLQKGRAFEATTYVDRAAAASPADGRIKALQAYVYLLLGRITDAAAAGKAALEAKETSPFTMATLAQIHRRMGYTPKALEFGTVAGRAFYGMDFLAENHRVILPLTMTITDTPQVLAPAPEEPVKTVQRTDMELTVPPATSAAALPEFEIGAPKDGATVRGTVRVHAMYRGAKEVKFVVFLADGVLTGMTTEIPYQFRWNADGATDGEHKLTVRAYDYRGALMLERTTTVTTAAGIPPATATPTARQAELTRRIMADTMPQPSPLSLFTLLGQWYKESAEVPRAIAAFEKAAAIDPTAEGVLDTLSDLYRAHGLHPASPTGEVSRAPSKAQKRVAITFDDGPNPLFTPTILAELKRAGALCTFFVVGKMVQAYPDLTLQILAEGHELANHTYTHPNITKLKPEEVVSEVLRTRAAIKEITGKQTYYFRPPGGNIDPGVTKQLRALDYNIIYWDINAGEYRKLAPEKQAAQMVDKVQDGSILLLHNGPVDGTLNILPTLLAELTKRGFACVTVSELLKDADKDAIKDMPNDIRVRDAMGK
jgi:peptidoglycan/xylan/chitin deacetylase (PgdA/CDA1 family)